jgi:hypothetical protein
METAEVRRRVTAAIEQARRHTAERRARTAEAARDYARFLDQIAVPLFRQIAQVLKVEGYQYSVFTPGGSVRLMSDRSAQDYVEVALDTSGDEPRVVGHVSRTRGRRIVESERSVSDAPVAAVTEDDLLRYVLKELEPFVEK